MSGCTDRDSSLVFFCSSVYSVYLLLVPSLLSTCLVSMTPPQMMKVVLYKNPSTLIQTHLDSAVLTSKTPPWTILLAQYKIMNRIMNLRNNV